MQTLYRTIDNFSRARENLKHPHAAKGAVQDRELQLVEMFLHKLERIKTEYEDAQDVVMRNNVYWQQHTPRNGVKGDIWFKKEYRDGKEYMQKYVCGEHTWEHADKQHAYTFKDSLNLDNQMSDGQAIYAMELQLARIERALNQTRHLQDTQLILEYEGLVESLSIVIDLAKRSAFKEGM